LGVTLFKVESERLERYLNNSSVVGVEIDTFPLSLILLCKQNLTGRPLLFSLSLPPFLIPLPPTLASAHMARHV